MTWILAPELLLDGLEARAGWGIAIDHGTIVALGPVAAL